MLISVLVEQLSLKLLIDEHVSTGKSPVLGHERLVHFLKEPYDVSVFFDILPLDT